MNNKEHQRNILDNLVYQVFVRDKETFVILNIGNDENLESIPLADIESIKNNIN